MHYVIYLSTAAHLFSEDELHQILEASRTNNASRGISGMLLYHDGAILQVLEGEENVINSLFEQIKCDTRHHSIIKVLNGPIAQRSFAQWSMGFKKLSLREWDTVNGYVPVTGKSLPVGQSAGGNDDMLTFIKSFCQANFR